MEIFKINQNKLEQIDSKPFSSEKEIQTIVENNTETLFNLKFVKTEMVCGDSRIDTLCYDEESNSFVIIEYKNSKSASVIDQGYSYLSIMLNNKSDFVLEYNENMDKTIKRDNVDWSQSRVLFISTFFTQYQINSVNFKDVPFKLWEIQKFSNETVCFQEIISNSKESIKGLEKGKNSIVNKVSSEIKNYDEEQVVTKFNRDNWEVYKLLRDKVLEWGNVVIKVKKGYVSFWKNRPVVFYVTPRKKGLFVEFVYRVDFKGNVKSQKRIFEFKDPEKIFKLYENKYKETFFTRIDNNSDLEYIIYCLKQKYDSIK